MIINDECRHLEETLSKYTLWGNLIPQTSFEMNLRAVLSPTDWDKLRRSVYKAFGYKCVICDHAGQMEAHELWRFDYEKSVQVLDFVVALCKYCHLHQHLGFAKGLMGQGNLDPKPFYHHWFVVNKLKPNNEMLSEYESRVFKLWRLRNEFAWKIVLKDGKPITKNMTLEEILVTTFRTP